MNGLDRVKFGGGPASSVLHPAVLVMMLITIALMWALPRRHIVVPYLFMILIAPFGQQIYVAGVHLFVIRILIVCGLLRVPWKMAGFNVLDKVFLLWASFRALATFLEFGELQAAINQAGFLWDVVGGYLLLRFLIQDEDDIASVIKTFSVVAIVLAFTMSGEHFTGRNVYGLIGGHSVSPIRDGAIRAEGPFAGPIPAGTLGATLLCPFIWLCWSRRSMLFGVLGIIGASVMMWTSASSTALLAFPAGILAICFWPLRNSMRMVRYGLALILTALHLVMKAPVWMLIARVSLVGGNSSYHRAELVDQFVQHFSDWWLIGVQSTASWGWDMWDQANQFVAEGEGGGLATFICFILLVSWSFGRLATARKLAGSNRKSAVLLWLLGATLFSYVVAFFGISFSDQTQNVWFALLAMISAASAPFLLKTAEQKAESPTLATVSPQLADSGQPTGQRDLWDEWCANYRKNAQAIHRG